MGRKKKENIRYCTHCGAPRTGRFFSVKTAARITDESESVWRTRINERVIRTVKFGKSVRIPADALYEFCTENLNLNEIILEKDME